MGERFRISAKKLGYLAMPDFCARCFWIKTHLEGEPPFNVFPRIFNDIDGYVKRVVHGWFDELIEPPGWLSELGVLTGYLNPPRSSEFQMLIDDNVLLTGEADAIFKLVGDTLVVGDYKTAFCRGIDDPLYRIYYVQLNCYALLAETLHLGSVKKLALIYTEPATGDQSARLEENRTKTGFKLGFNTKILEIPLDTACVAKFAAAAYQVHSQPTVPKGRDGCVDCKRLQNLIDTVNLCKYDYAALFPLTS